MPSTFISQLLSERGLPALFEAGASTAPANYALWANTGTAPAGTAVGSSTPTRVGADLGWTFNGSGNLYWSATNAATYMPTSGGSLICFDWTPSSTSTSEIITWGTSAGTVRRRVVVDSVGFYLTGTAGYSTWDNTLVSGTRYRVVIYTDGTHASSRCWVGGVENTDHSVTGIDDMDATGYDEIRIGSRQNALGSSYGTIHSVFVAHATQAPSQTLIDLFGSTSAADIRTELETYRTTIEAANTAGETIGVLFRDAESRTDGLTDPAGSIWVDGPVTSVDTTDRYPTVNSGYTIGWDALPDVVRRMATRSDVHSESRLSGYVGLMASSSWLADEFRFDLPHGGLWLVSLGAGLYPINGWRMAADVKIGGTVVGRIGNPGTTYLSTQMPESGGNVGPAVTRLDATGYLGGSDGAVVPGLLVDATASQDLRICYPAGEANEMIWGYIGLIPLGAAETAALRRVQAWSGGFTDSFIGGVA